MNLRNRLDMCEKQDSMIRKSLTDQEKKIKVIKAGGARGGASGINGS